MFPNAQTSLVRHTRGDIKHLRAGPTPIRVLVTMPNDFKQSGFGPKANVGLRLFFGFG